MKNCNSQPILRALQTVTFEILRQGKLKVTEYPGVTIAPHD